MPNLFHLVAGDALSPDAAQTLETPARGGRAATHEFSDILRARIGTNPSVEAVAGEPSPPTGKNLPLEAPDDGAGSVAAPPPDGAGAVIGVENPADTTAQPEFALDDRQVLTISTAGAPSLSNAAADSRRPIPVAAAGEVTTPPRSPGDRPVATIVNAAAGALSAAAVSGYHRAPPVPPVRPVSSGDTQNATLPGGRSVAPVSPSQAGDPLPVTRGDSKRSFSAATEHYRVPGDAAASRSASRTDVIGNFPGANPAADRLSTPVTEATPGNAGLAGDAAWAGATPRRNSSTTIVAHAGHDLCRGSGRPEIRAGRDAVPVDRPQISGSDTGSLNNPSPPTRPIAESSGMRVSSMQTDAATPEAPRPPISSEWGDVRTNPSREVVQLEAQLRESRPAGAMALEIDSPYTSAAAPRASADSSPTAVRPSVAHAIEITLKEPGWDKALSERVTMMAHGKVQNAEIRLTPAELGPLRVQVLIDDTTASVSFQAQHAPTREAIAEALPRLREMLAEHGLSLGQTDVSDGGGERESHGGPRGTSLNEGRQADDASHEHLESNRRTGIPADALVDTFV